MGPPRQCSRELNASRRAHAGRENARHLHVWRHHRCHRLIAHLSPVGRCSAPPRGSISPRRLVKRANSRIPQPGSRQTARRKSRGAAEDVAASSAAPLPRPVLRTRLAHRCHHSLHAWTTNARVREINDDSRSFETLICITASSGAVHLKANRTRIVAKSSCLAAARGVGPDLEEALNGGDDRLRNGDERRNDRSGNRKDQRAEPLNDGAAVLQPTRRSGLLSDVHDRAQRRLDQELRHWRERRRHGRLSIGNYCRKCSSRSDRACGGTDLQSSNSPTKMCRHSRHVPPCLLKRL
ncbi:hypothetical protein BCL50_1780 [Mycolicibacterium litorale]|nr:hypothetical protein BCL50_1780 [Mycolicibacterium litorale]